MRIDVYHHYELAPEVLAKLDGISRKQDLILERLATMSKELDDKITTMQASVTALTTIDASLRKLLTDQNQLLKDAIAAAQNAGATPQQLQALNDLATTVDGEVAANTQAVKDNTPAA